MYVWTALLPPGSTQPTPGPPPRARVFCFLSGGFLAKARLLVPNNVDAWVAAIKELCYNDKLRKQLIELSRARRSQFSWDKCAGETWQVFKLILESPEKNITNSELDDD